MQLCCLLVQTALWFCVRNSTYTNAVDRGGHTRWTSVQTSMMAKPNIPSKGRRAGEQMERKGIAAEDAQATQQGKRSLALVQCDGAWRKRASSLSSVMPEA